MLYAHIMAEINCSNPLSTYRNKSLIYPSFGSASLLESSELVAIIRHNYYQYLHIRRCPTHIFGTLYPPIFNRFRKCSQSIFRTHDHAERFTGTLRHTYTTAYATQLTNFYNCIIAHFQRTELTMIYTSLATIA